MFKEIVVGLLLLTSTAFAGGTATREIDTNFVRGALAYRNYVLNPGAEKNVTNNVTTANSATVTRNTSSPIEGTGDFSVSLTNNTNGSITWALDTLDPKLSGKNCEFTVYYTASSIGSSVKFDVLIGSTVVVSSSALATATVAQGITLNTPCGDLSSATTVRIANQSGNSGTSAVKVDGLYYGLATNVTQGSQAKFVGSVKWAATTSCQWTSGGTSFANYSNDNDCDDNARTVTGAVTDSSAGLRPEVSVINPAPGRYVVRATASFYKTGTTNYSCHFTVADGTSTATAGVVATNSTELQVPHYQGELSYAVAPSTLTFNIQSKSPGSGGCATDATATGLELAVYWYPPANEMGVRPDQADFPFTRYAGLEATTGVWNGFGTLGAAEVSISRQGDSLYILSNIKAGTVTAAPSRVSLSALGVTMDTTKLGSRSKVLGTCIDLQNANANIGSSNLIPYAYYNGSDASNIYFSQNVQTYDWTARNTNDFVSNSDAFSCTIGPIPISQWTGNQSAPLLVGSITSGASGARRLESVKFADNSAGTTSCTSNPCTLSQVSSSWVTSVSRSGTGTYTINIASGVFSAEPTCTCGHGQGSNGACYVQPGSATSIPILSNNFAVGIDTVMNVICEGPR